MIFLWILLGVGIAITLYFVIGAIVLFVSIMKKFKGKHHCNYCKLTFIFKGEDKYIFCPYCGEPLSYHCYDEKMKNENSFDIDVSKVIITEEKEK